MVQQVTGRHDPHSTRDTLRESLDPPCGPSCGPRRPSSSTLGGDPHESCLYLVLLRRYSPPPVLLRFLTRTLGVPPPTPSFPSILLPPSPPPHLLPSSQCFLGHPMLYSVSVPGPRLTCLHSGLVYYDSLDLSQVWESQGSFWGRRSSSWTHKFRK